MALWEGFVWKWHPICAQKISQTLQYWSWSPCPCSIPHLVPEYTISPWYNVIVRMTYAKSNRKISTHLASVIRKYILPLTRSPEVGQLQCWLIQHLKDIIKDFSPVFWLGHPQHLSGISSNQITSWYQDGCHWHRGHTLTSQHPEEKPPLSMCVFLNGSESGREITGRRNNVCKGPEVE